MSDPSIYRQLSDLEERLRRVETIERAAFIGARYTTDAGQSIPNGVSTIVNFEDVDYDPLGLVTTGAGWVFTCPVAGYYRVSAAILFDGTTAWFPGEYALIAIYKNSALFSFLERRDDWPSGATLFAGLGGGDVVPCAAGDTLQVQVDQGSGGAVPLFNSSNFNYISITRVG
jgi:hypothetical protein